MAWKRTVLVVANVTATSDELLAVLEARAQREPARFTLIVPATPFGGGRAAAETKVFDAIDRLRAAGLEADGAVGNPDPVVAVIEVVGPPQLRRDRRLDAADEAVEVAARRPARADLEADGRPGHAPCLPTAATRGADRSSAGARGSRCRDGTAVGPRLGLRQVRLTPVARVSIARPCDNRSRCQPTSARS